MSGLDWRVALAVFVIFTLVGALASQTDISRFAQKCKRPKGLLIGVGCQYLMLPFFGYAVGVVFDFEPVFAVALLIVSTSPGGTLSNLFAFLFGADLPLSLAMTTCTSLLAFAFILFNGWLYVEMAMRSKRNDDTVKVDFGGLALSVAVLIVALIFGLYASHRNWQPVKKALAVCGALSTVMLVVVAFVENFSAEQNIGQLHWRYWFGVVCLNLLAWFGGLVVAVAFKMKKSSALAMAIEISNQNTSLAATIILLSFPEKEDGNKAIGIPLMYTFCSWAVVLTLAPAFHWIGWTETTEAAVHTEDSSERNWFARFRAAKLKAEEVGVDTEAVAENCAMDATFGSCQPQLGLCFNGSDAIEEMQIEADESQQFVEATNSSILGDCENEEKNTV